MIATGNFGSPPISVGYFGFDLPEVMYYLYLPVWMGPADREDVRLPPNVECCRELIRWAGSYGEYRRQYIYLSARKGWATPDNPLNRPGWHCDGFGTDDLNFVWWTGPGTRFAIQDFHDISEDDTKSLAQFEVQVQDDRVASFPQKVLYAIDPFVVHATPLIDPPGCMRQYVKVSLSNHQYNLENNSHNHLFDYQWKLSSRDLIRNSPHRAQKDFS
jgi:hypothetical protein